MHTKTPPERLELLLPWLNLALPERREVVKGPGMVRRWLFDFLRAFDGSREAGYVQQVYDGTREEDGRSLFRNVAEWPKLSEREEDDLTRLRSDLVDILNAGFAVRQPRTRWWNPDEFETLWFSVEGHQRNAKVSAMTAKERRDHLGSGAYVLLVNGALRDLVRFLVGFLLTQPGMVTITRCPAPKPGDWKQRCDRFVVGNHGRGRPRTFCSDACRVRFSTKEKGERNKRGAR